MRPRLARSAWATRLLSTGGRRIASLAFTAALATTMAACDDSPTVPAPVESSLLPLNDLRLLTFATYDSSGQVVHPDYARTPAILFGLPHQLAITPYPFGDAKHENPSLFGSTTLDAWNLGDGVPNPIVRPERGYLSDPDLVYVPEYQELWLYYRQVTSDNIIWLVRSKNGRDWSAPVEVVRAPNHQIISPSVVRRGATDWWMFSVNAGPVGCSAKATTVEIRKSSDGLNWDMPQTVEIGTSDFPNLWPWHIDVQWIPSQRAFWAIYNGKTNSGCTTPAVFMATSEDGVTWTTALQPVLAKGRHPALKDIVYRSTFDYDPTADALTFWYSGATLDAGQYVWSAAVERRRREDVFAPSGMRIEARVDKIMTPAPMPLTDWP